MAYLAFQGIGGASRTDAAIAAPAVDDRLTTLEWSVVRLARRDRPITIRPETWLSRLIRTIFQQRNPQLADARLEALRRMAVLAWHHGYTVPSHEVRAFLDAGFSKRQYETMVDHIGNARAAAPRTIGA